VVTLDELLNLQRLSQPRFAPDGQTLAFLTASSFAQPGQGPGSRIAMMTADGELLHETAGAHDRLPRWSPDGTSLAFLSDAVRPGVSALHVLNLQSGAVAALGQIEGAVEDFAWSRDGRELFVLAEHGPPAPADEPGADQPACGPDPRVIRPGQSWQRLYRVVVASGQTTAVGPSDLSVWEFDWDGLNTVVAIFSVDPSESGWYTAFLGLIDLVDDTVQVIHRPQWQMSSPSLSPGGQHVAFLEGICSDRGSMSGTVNVVSTRSETAAAGGLQGGTQLAPDLDLTGLGWINDQRLFYAGRCGLVSTCGTLSLGDVRDELWRGAAAVREVSASADGRWLAAVKETASEPAEIAKLELASPTRGWEAISSVNSGLAGLALPLVEPLHWSAADGLDIEGLLVRPRESGPEERPPLVVLVHGGPTAAWSYAFPCGNRNAALLAGAGYAVLLPNPRGSSGRGQQFARAVVGDLGGAELNDTLSGVQACVDAGYADGERVGIMGASHGGFIAAWAPTQTTRFRAGVAIACVSDYLSLHYTSNIGGLDDILFVGPDRVADYLARSPIAYVNRCVAPMLIVHGEQDRCCPVSQAEEFYGGLVENGVETELVIYPREGHGYIEREHQLDLWRRVHAWFDRHLAVRT